MFKKRGTQLSIIATAALSSVGRVEGSAISVSGLAIPYHSEKLVAWEHGWSSRVASINPEHAPMV